MNFSKREFFENLGNFYEKIDLPGASKSSECVTTSLLSIEIARLYMGASKTKDSNSPPTACSRKCSKKKISR